MNSGRPSLLLRFSRCSLRRFFSSLLACPRPHFLILHFFLWMVSEQWSPPNCGSSVTVRVRMVWPFPHDLVHSDHSVHSDMAQFTAEETQFGRQIMFRVKVLRLRSGCMLYCLTTRCPRFATRFQKLAKKNNKFFFASLLQLCS